MNEINIPESMTDIEEEFTVAWFELKNKNNEEQSTMDQDSQNFNVLKQAVGQIIEGQVAEKQQIRTKTWPDGTKYEGDMKDGKPHGYGRKVYRNKIHVGQFLNGKRHGRGITRMQNGAVYRGEFKDNVPDGEGVETLKSGKKYVGSFKNNKKHGYGEETYPSGRQYKGYWKNDKYHGKGTFSRINRFKYAGEFENGLPHGKGVSITRSGTKHVG